MGREADVLGKHDTCRRCGSRRRSGDRGFQGHIDFGRSRHWRRLDPQDGGGDACAGAFEQHLRAGIGCGDIRRRGHIAGRCPGRIRQWCCIMWMAGDCAPERRWRDVPERHDVLGSRFRALPAVVREGGDNCRKCSRRWSGRGKRPLGRCWYDNDKNRYGREVHW